MMIAPLLFVFVDTCRSSSLWGIRCTVDRAWMPIAKYSMMRIGNKIANDEFD
jgi:hypothetical protein